MCEFMPRQETLGNTQSVSSATAFRTSRIALLGLMLPLSMSILALSCNREVPVAPRQLSQINLNCRESDYTKITIGISISDKASVYEVALSRDGRRIFTGPFLGGGTIIIDTLLTPSTTFRYRGYALEGGRAIDSSDILTVRTKDTTSDQFDWDVTYFGNGYSIFHDVCAISSNDVWAVGDVEFPDSLRENIWNAAHWDGKKWTLKRIAYNIDYGGGQILRTDQIATLSVFACGEKDVWFGSDAGGAARLLNNQLLEITPPYPEGPGATNRIWGYGNSVYFAGNKGRIVYWNGKDFSVVATDFKYDVNDIWGVGDTAICIASNWLFEASESRVVRLVAGKAALFPETGLQRAMKTLWFQRQDRIFASGGFQLEFDGKTWNRVPNPAEYFQLAMRGIAENDIFCVGQLGNIMHFNGLRWTRITNFPPDPVMECRAVAMLPNEVFVVGYGTARKAMVLHGRRH
jgi:hypothetical protein